MILSSVIVMVVLTRTSELRIWLRVIQYLSKKNVTREWQTVATSGEQHLCGIGGDFWRNFEGERWRLGIFMKFLARALVRFDVANLGKLIAGARR